MSSFKTIIVGFLASLFFTFSVSHAAPSAKDFGALPTIHDADLSPDGREIAVLVNHEGKYVVRVSLLSDLKGSTRVIALGKEMKPKYLKWANNDRLLVSFRQNEKVGRASSSKTLVRTSYFFTLDTKTMKGKILIDPSKGDVLIGSTSEVKYRQFNDRVVDWLEDDPDHILMAFGDFNGLKPDVRRVNVETGRDRIVKRGMKNVQRWIADVDGTPRIGKGRRDSDGSWVMRIRDKGDDKWRLSDEYPNLDADNNVYGFTSNGNAIVISDYQDKDTLGLYVYDLDQKRITRKLFHNESYDVTGVVFSKSGNEIIGAKYISDSPQVEMLSGNNNVMARVQEVFQGSEVRFIDQNEAGTQSLFKVSSPSDPGQLVYVDGNNPPRSLGSLRSKLKPLDMGEVVSLRYSSRDGQKIPAFVTIPPSITNTAQLKKLPFIILPHGGPYARDSKRFDYFAQFFASRGYGVLQMNFRGSEGYGKAYKTAGRDNWVVMQEDVEDGTKWLISKGYADPNRICIAGWSYGGYAALMGAAKNPDLYKCAVSMAGLTDIKSHVRDRKEYRFGKFNSKNFIGKGFKDSDDIKANSPVKIAEDITVPVYLAHGTADQVVYYSQFTRMKNALKKSKAKVTAISFKDGDHDLSRQKNREEFFVGLEKFLTKVNGKSEFMQ